MIKKEYCIIGFGIFWMLYSITINTFGFCHYWIEEFEDDAWYVMYGDSEDGAYYEDYIDGPLQKQEAIIRINELKLEAKKFRQTYGTIFNLIPETETYKDIYEKGGSIIQILLFHTFLWIPLILLYTYFNKVKLK